MSRGGREDRQAPGLLCAARQRRAHGQDRHAQGIAGPSGGAGADPLGS